MKRHATCFVGKAGFEPRTLGTKAERYDHCATRPVDQFSMSKRRTMLNSIRRIGLLDVSQPSRSHGRKEPITKIVNPLSNCSTFIHHNVTKINAYLQTQLQ